MFENVIRVLGDTDSWEFSGHHRQINNLPVVYLVHVIN